MRTSKLIANGIFIQKAYYAKTTTIGKFKIDFQRVSKMLTTQNEKCKMKNEKEELFYIFHFSFYISILRDLYQELVQVCIFIGEAKFFAQAVATGLNPSGGNVHQLGNFFGR